MAEKVKIKTEIETLRTAAEKASPKEKEFLTSFMKQLMLAKEKQKTERAEMKSMKKLITERKIAKIEERLRPSVMKKGKMRKKLRPLTIEEEKIEAPAKKEKRVEIAPQPTPSAMEIAPIYKRPLPALPKPKEMKYPLPVLRPARPPEEEAMAPPTAEMPYPEAPIYPAALEEKPKEKEKTIPLIELDLGKLNLLIRDESVSVIQCDGANLPIKVTREGVVSETKIKLNEDEIKETIQKFADRAGKPLSEPLFKTQVGNLEITSVMSAFAGSRFVISKT